MKKTIFFNNPVGTEKLQFIVSDLSVEALKDNGIIPKKSAALSMPFIDKSSSIEKVALVSFPDRCVFDDYKNPTEVMLDIDLINSFVMSQIKTARLECLSLLDTYQMRAIAKNDQDVIARIESDKQKLRDIPDTIDFENVTDFRSACKAIPFADLVPEPYVSKYEDALK